MLKIGDIYLLDRLSEYQLVQVLYVGRTVEYKVLMNINKDGSYFNYNQEMHLSVFTRCITSKEHLYNNRWSKAKLDYIFEKIDEEVALTSQIFDSQLKFDI